MKYVFFSAFCLWSTEAFVAPPTRLEFMGLPAVNYSSDSGLGFGVLLSMHAKNQKLRPYSYALDLQFFMTTLGQHSHALKFDWLEAFQLPLRLRAKTKFLHTINQNYCGLGSAADCFQPVFSENPSKYFLFRYFEVYGTVDGRWRLRDLPHKIELMASWRGSYYWPGTWGDSTAFPDSLYVRDFPDEREQRGFASVFEAGMMFDDRDNEPSPIQGYWAEAALRGSAPWTGSSWSYWGFNVSLRGYLPLDHQKRFVLADQVIIDGLVGDALLPEIVRVGGSLQSIAYGGDKIGRGLREEYFPGRIKLIDQLEFRYRFTEFKALNQNFALSAVLFADAGFTSWDWNNISNQLPKPLLGTGGGLRIAWNESFVIRLDVGVSPFESYQPRIYMQLGNVF